MLSWVFIRQRNWNSTWTFCTEKTSRAGILNCCRQMTTTGMSKLLVKIWGWVLTGNGRQMRAGFIHSPQECRRLKVNESMKPGNWLKLPRWLKIPVRAREKEKGWQKQRNVLLHAKFLTLITAKTTLKNSGLIGKLRLIQVLLKMKRALELLRTNTITIFMPSAPKRMLKSIRSPMNRHWNCWIPLFNNELIWISNLISDGDYAPT